MGTGSFPRVKRPGRGVDHPNPSSAEVAGRVELYIYSPLWAVRLLSDKDRSMGRDSSVGIATRYGLDGPGIESRLGGEIFCTCPDWSWGTPSLLYNEYWVFPEGKAAGMWR